MPPITITRLSAGACGGCFPRAMSIPGGNRMTLATELIRFLDIFLAASA